MFIRSALLAVLIAGAVPLLAQPPAGGTPAPAQAPRAPRTEQPPPAVPAPAPGVPVQRNPMPPAPRREGQPVNIKVDFTITDQRGGAAAIKRTLTLMVADERTGSIRTQANVYQVGEVPLNIDASPTLLTDGKIRLGFNLQYDWPAPFETGQTLPRGTVIKTTLHENVALILENGKSMVAAQSADPIGDRQVTVEVKATVLR